ncbi:E3 ubiquitin-protein ligase rad18 [Imshaugia aleurites]|uniref:Postreplication repair E3 ubiquitin-protein ligase RAD18 n=1 Tax=Imshaugia aleurites TaxID=172621 RepID=A0A8H3I3X3_9LECA|nr:E3 ubiquitin-protein ligase rad18 [Imshaugia aleurites]
MKLRLNSTVQELVDAFKAARPAILLFVQNVEAAKGGIVEVKKRKIDDTDMEEDKDEHEEDMDHSLRRRKVKSRRRRRSISDGVEHDLFAYDGTNAGSQPDDGLTACPICGARMKEESVYPHLDVHSNSASTKSPAGQTPSHLNVTANSRSSKAMERLPQLNYFLLKDDALRKKLSELGIPNVGPKDLLIRRHTEWVNLVNANCDSSKPKMKRELLHELEGWDRTQGRQIMSNCNGAGTSSSVMSKDFDGAAWATNHGNNFQTLIAQARRKVNSKVEHTSSTNETPDPVLDQRIDNEHLATSPNRNPAESIDQLHAIQSPGNLADLDVGD